ncbi:MAG: hypothetical protein RLZ97_2476, partial [Verrucomicrobiota bacterium]
FEVFSGSLSLRGITLKDGSGGAIIQNPGTTLELIDCAVIGNSTSANGGGILSFGPLTLERCTFSGNSVGLSGEGGAVRSENAAFTVINCTFSGNSAKLGGACFIAGTGPAVFTHCTIGGNSAAGDSNNRGGGGLYFYNRGADIRNCIIARNTSGFDGGKDIETDHDGSTSPIFTTETNLIGSNKGVLSLFPEGSPNAHGDFVGSESTPLDPGLSPPGDNAGKLQTMALLPGSLAIDAGTIGSPALAVDQRGLPRNRDGDAIPGALPDIGAYEAQLAPVALGFNFNSDDPRNLSPSERAGAPEFAQTAWNNLSGALQSESTSSRTLCGGPSISVGTAWAGPNVRSFGSVTTPDEKLMRGYLDSNGAANSGTDLYQIQNQPFFALTDLPPALTLGGYKVVVYADTDTADHRIAEYWLTNHSAANNISGTGVLSPRLFLKDSTNFAGNYTRVLATSTAGNWASAGNYMVFENQTQPAFILRTAEFSGPELRAAISAVQVVRNEILVVTTAADEFDPVGTIGTGLSLREAVALAPTGSGITFDPALNGQTITIAAPRREIYIWKSLTIDASNLPDGLTINGRNASRIFDLGGSGSVIISMKGLTLKGGYGSVTGYNPYAGGAIQMRNVELQLSQCKLFGNTAQDGGAIFNSSGKLTLTQCLLWQNSASGFGPSNGGAISGGSTHPLTLRHCELVDNSAGSWGGAISAYFQAVVLNDCTLSGNSATNGGAIYGVGSMAQLTRCTLAGNSANVGGSISLGGDLTLTQCTVFGNSATTSGGAIYQKGSSLRVNHSTLSGNSASDGGAIYFENRLTLENSIVAGNTAAMGADIRVVHQPTTPTPWYVRTGANIVQSISSSGLLNSSGTASLNSAPLLAPLGDYGGSTPTMALRIGSPARNASVGSTRITDQRGFPMIGKPDLGSYEAGTTSKHYNAWIWETLPTTAIPEQHATTFDYDGDGNSNELEWLAGTIPTQPGSVFRPVSAVDGQDLLITFPTVSGRTYQLQQSDNLAAESWTNRGSSLMGQGNQHTFRIPIATPTRRFFRVRIMP